jgi:hypothetical protein
MREFARQRKSLARGNLWKTKAARDLTGISKPARTARIGIPNDGPQTIDFGPHVCGGKLHMGSPAPQAANFVGAPALPGDQRSKSLKTSENKGEILDTSSPQL